MNAPRWTQLKAFEKSILTKTFSAPQFLDLNSWSAWMAASVPPGTATPSWHTCIRWTLASRANWRQRCFAVSLLQVSPTAIGRYSPGLPSFSMAVRFAPAMRGAMVLGARPFARSFTTFVKEARSPGTSPRSTASLRCCGARPEGPPLEPL